MSKYVRTKKGEILDLEKIKLEVRDNEFYYKDFVFEEIKQDGNDIRLDYSAIGTVESRLEEQKGKRCKFALVKYDDEILKQADTIEELCDEFVIVDSRTGLVVSIERAIQFNKNYWKAKYFIIYGSIWTNKGLVYVAEMNKDGELELCKD